ncbi:hypothetical protein Q3A66_02630 [Hymenobacter sp. BT770]|uniref:hypothetical protein n=1 Tax=Hymenobacter sp. BT770 TaxID=2886942 RepID=UPI001D11DCD4|nr:hypothetical protein [Hymenobacter sp. BT770]MCC3151474.1 hypothetical protein [Hymenobacter sp. BT770]MDO3413950.1 hypothetical protein [Hymenobacter sp. BT770]
MSKLYAFAAFVLFMGLSTSLIRLQLASSPVSKMRVPTYRSVSVASHAMDRITRPIVGIYN